MRKGTRAELVHANAVRRQEAGKILSKLNYSGFGRSITRWVRKLFSIVHSIVGSEMAVQRADVEDYSPSGFEVRERRLGHTEDRVQTHVDIVFPILLSNGFPRVLLTRPRVVHEDVDGWEVLVHLSKELGGGILLQQIEFQSDCLDLAAGQLDKFL